MNQRHVTAHGYGQTGTKYPTCVPKTKRGGERSIHDSSSNSDTDDKRVRRKTSKEGNERCLSRAIQANAKALAENLPFKDCELADEVVKKECITEDECEAIREISDRKTQVRDIILIIKTRSYKTMENFLDAAKLHCPSIVDDIWKLYNRYIAENRSCTMQCWFCSLKSSVDVKRVVDSLWSEDVLDDATVREINLCNDVVGRQDKSWTIILDKLESNRRGLNVLCKALESNGHYTHIAKSLHTLLRQNNQVLSCTCSMLNVRFRRPSSINGEMPSETESILPVESVNSDVEPIPSEESLHSDDELTDIKLNVEKTYENPNFYSNKGKVTAEDTTTLNIHEVKHFNNDQSGNTLGPTTNTERHKIPQLR